MPMRFNGVIEDFPCLRVRHLRGEDLEGFEGCHVDGARVDLQRHGKPYARFNLTCCRSSTGYARSCCVPAAVPGGPCWC